VRFQEREEKSGLSKSLGGYSLNSSVQAGGLKCKIDVHCWMRILWLICLACTLAGNCPLHSSQSH
jgi:hypothetical protein